MLKDIDDEAARWAIAAVDGSASQEELQLWLAQDRRHQGAYLRARASLKLLDRALQAAAPQPDVHCDNDNEQPAPRRSARWWWGGMATAACAAILAVMVVQTADPARPDAALVRMLDDGSRVTLAEDGRIDVVMTDNLRKIILHDGGATFSVASDRARPFVVQAGSVYAQATGTVYSVARHGPEGGTVMVQEGSVLVWSRDERDQAVLLRAGDKLTLEPGAVKADRPPPPPRQLPDPDMAKISLDDVTIASAVKRFNSLNETQILIADEEIAETRIVGLFKASDPLGFAQTVVAFTDAEMVETKDTIVLKKKQ